MLVIFRLAALLIAVGIALPPLGGSAAARAPERSAATVMAVPRSAAVRPLRLLVRFVEGASAEERADAVRSVGGRVDRTLAAIGITRVVLPLPDVAIEDGPGVAAVLARHPAVEAVEHDASVGLRFAPNDPFYANDPHSGLGQWSLRRAGVDRAWDVTRGSPLVTVAVIDTGVDASHPDLAGVVAGSTTTLSDVSGECAPSTRDDNSHGTHVAGIIGAIGNNGVGIAGAAFGVRIISAKALDCTGKGALSDVAAALVWAVDRGAKVVNISLGGGESMTLREALRYALARNVLVVVAAGNCGAASPHCAGLNSPEYPAAYPEAFAVAATDTDDTRASFSTQAPYVAIAAPGRRIVSTTPTYPTYQSARGVGIGYAALSGTSEASPLVAAIAALVWGQEPSLTAAGVRERLTATADDLGAPGVDTAFGAGRVNALRAVTNATALQYGAAYDAALVPRSARAGASFVANVRVTNGSSFGWSAAGPSATRLAWSWRDVAGREVASGAPATLPFDVPVGSSALVAVAVVAPSSRGAHTLRFDLVREAIAFSSRSVPPADLAVSIGSGLGATYAPAATAASFGAGVAGSLAVSLTNSGTETWRAGGANPVRLSYHLLRAERTVAVWDGQRAVLPADQAPGATVTLTLPIAPPDQPGTYTLRLDLVQEGLAWFSAEGVEPRDLPISVRAAYAASYGGPIAVPTLLPGGRALVPVVIRNEGAATWSAAALRVAAHVSDTRGNTVTWDGARTMLPGDLAPDASASVSVIVDAPLAAGIYRARVDVVREGVAWLSGLGSATADATFFVAPDFRASLPAGPLSVARAAPVVTVTVTNSSSATWTTGGSAPVALSAHWLGAGGAVLAWDGPRTPLPRAVAPGESLTLGVALGTPPPSATAVVIDLVAEGLRWFGAGTARPVTLTP